MSGTGRKGRMSKALEAELIEIEAEHKLLKANIRQVRDKLAYRLDSQLKRVIGI